MKKLIIGNWKLNPQTLKEAEKLASKIERNSKHTTAICPPHIFLGKLNFPRVGAQDCHWQDKGPYTGQVSPAQLKSVKVKYCIVGHSEKRAMGDTDGMVNLKVNSLLTHKITPVLCIGYGTTVEQDDLEVVDILKSQLTADLRGADASKVIVAYEPVWAISSGNALATKKIASPEHAEKIAIFIKSKFSVVKVIYGGSANIYNAEGFLAHPHIDGLLLGGESLIPEHFNQIINM